MPRNKNEASCRYWNCLLYPDDLSQAFAISALRGTAYNCVGILHDKDVKEDGSGELKKPHFHIVIKFANARSHSVVANELQLDERFLEPCRNWRASAEYLLHKGCPDKHQYSIEELFGSLKKALEQLISDDTEDERALKIIKLLNEIQHPITMMEFINLCAENGLFADLRRGGYLFVQALKEHNSGYGWN